VAVKLLLFSQAQNNWPSMSDAGRFFYILLIVVFIALLAYFSTKILAMSRSGRFRSSKRNLEMVESMGVGTQSMVQIIRAGEKYWLIGVTKERVTLLSALEDGTLNFPAPRVQDNPFESVLSRILSRNKKGVGNDAENNAES